MNQEMAIPKEVLDKLKTAKIFRPTGNTDSEKLYVEFTEDTIPGIVFKYVKNLNHNSSVHTFIPPHFKAREEDLEKCAYDLRHGTPAYHTKIKRGSCDLLLERKLKSNPSERYNCVKNLPPVDLYPSAPGPKFPTPSTSPAPERKTRNKRVRSITPTHSSPSPKTIRQKDWSAMTNPQSQGLFRLENFRSPARSAEVYQIPLFRKAGSKAARPLGFQ